MLVVRSYIFQVIIYWSKLVFYQLCCLKYHVWTSIKRVINFIINKTRRWMVFMVLSNSFEYASTWCTPLISRLIFTASQRIKYNWQLLVSYCITGLLKLKDMIWRRFDWYSQHFERFCRAFLLHSRPGFLLEMVQTHNHNTRIYQRIMKSSSMLLFL